jgi:hypothetical protein
MDEDFWQPWCERPTALVVPSRVDPSGRNGPTKGAAAAAWRWRKVARGWYLPVEVDVEIVEQRILNEAMRLPAGSGLTAWASLRWRGAAYFDGRGATGRERLAVPLLLGNRNLRTSVTTRLSKEQFPPWEHEVVAGLPCAVVERSLYDETRWSPSDRRAVVAVDMTAAAGLITVVGFREYVESRPAWTGVYRARFAADHAVDTSRSPQESLMRLVWTLDAGLPTPLCNMPVFSLNGALLGSPDLFDPVAGLVGEYDGKNHLAEDRRSRDRTREERFRDHGLEYVAVVRGELRHASLVAERLRAAYRRAAFASPDQRRWTLDEPAWYLDRFAG